MATNKRIVRNLHEVYREGSFINVFADSIIRQFNDVLSNVEKLKKCIFISTAQGRYLDDIGMLFGLTRRSGEDDDTFRNRIINFVNIYSSCGTINDIKRAVAGVLGISSDDVDIEEFGEKYPPDIYLSMLRCYYKFSGSEWLKELSGYSNDLNINGTIIQSTDRFGIENESVKIEDYTINDVYLYSDYSENYEIKEEWSVCFWMKNIKYWYAVKFMIFGDSNVYWKFRWDGGTGHCLFRYYPLITDIRVSPLGSVFDQRWHFYCVVISKREGKVKTYFDGNVQQIRSFSWNNYIWSNSSKLRIGKINDPPVYYNIDMLIDDFMIFHKALTEDEIKLLYNLTALTGGKKIRVKFESDLSKVNEVKELVWSVKAAGIYPFFGITSSFVDSFSSSDNLIVNVTNRLYWGHSNWGDGTW